MLPPPVMMSAPAVLKMVSGPALAGPELEDAGGVMAAVTAAPASSLASDWGVPSIACR